MKKIFLGLSLGLLMSCQESSDDRQGSSDDLPDAPTTSGWETGRGTQTIAAPNAAQTKRTPLPLDTVSVRPRAIR